MVWTAPNVVRTDRPGVADERACLDGMLDYQRQTFLGKCGGLTGEQLATRSVGQSPLSLLGIMRHLADVERVWWRQRFLAEPVEYLYYSDDTPDFDFDGGTPETAPTDFAVYVREVETVRAMVASRPLDETFVRPNGELVDLRWLYLHLIAEYARHNGHADLLREHIDGVTGF